MRALQNLGTTGWSKDRYLPDYKQYSEFIEYLFWEFILYHWSVICIIRSVLYSWLYAAFLARVFKTSQTLTVKQWHNQSKLTYKTQLSSPWCSFIPWEPNIWGHVF